MALVSLSNKGEIQHTGVDARCGTRVIENSHEVLSGAVTCAENAADTSFSTTMTSLKKATIPTPPTGDAAKCESV